MVSFKSLFGVMMFASVMAHPHRAKRCAGTPTIPANGGIELPAPSAGLQLKAVALGRGRQNYTCIPSSTAVPVAVGAMATLYDVRSLAETNLDMLNTMVPKAAATTEEIVTKVAAKLMRDDGILGHHYFDASGVPTFDLGDLGFFRGAKTAAVPAPSNAYSGQSGSGAVDWLDLCDKGGSRSIKQTYRVVTAGGKPPVNCANSPASFSVEYATEYWFYG